MPSLSDVTLRPFELSDAEAFLTWAGDDAVTLHCRWDTFPDLNASRAFLRRVIDSHPWYKAICVAGAPVGSIFVMPGGGKDARRGEIGYALSATWWGRGVATSAVRLAVEAVRTELKGLERIEGLVFKENGASQRVLEKAGFVREGVLRKYFYVKGRSRDIVVYSIVNDVV